MQRMANIDWQNQKENIQQSTLNAKMELADINKKASTYYENYLKSKGLYGSGAGAGVYNDMQTNLMNATSQINQQGQKQLDNARQDRTSQMQSMIQSALQAGATNEDIDNITSRYAEDSLTPGAMSGVENLKTINDIQQRTKAEAEQKAKDEEDRAFLYQAYQQALANNASAEELQAIRDQYNNIGADERKLTTLEQLQEAANNKTASDEAKAKDAEQKATNRATLLTAYQEALTNGASEEQLEKIKNNYPELAEELKPELTLLQELSTIANAKTDKEKAEAENNAKETLIQTLGDEVAKLADMYGYTQSEIEAKNNAIQEIFNDTSLTTTEKYLKALAVTHGANDENGEQEPQTDGTVKDETTDTRVFENDEVRMANISAMQTLVASNPEAVHQKLYTYTNKAESLGHLGNAWGSTEAILKNAEAVYTNDEIANHYMNFYKEKSQGYQDEKYLNQLSEVMDSAINLANNGVLPNGTTISIAPNRGLINPSGNAAYVYYYDEDAKQGNWYLAEQKIATFDSVQGAEDLKKIVGSEIYSKYSKPGTQQPKVENKTTKTTSTTSKSKTDYYKNKTDNLILNNLAE